MLAVAEKEILIRDKKIESLESFIDKINKTGKIDTEIIE
jgi:hypothetical protein